jgi:nucleoside-diphosphate-sugar epimerase
VTGGAGFIGSNLVSALVAEGHRVRVLDDLSTGSMANLREVADAVDVLVGDVRAPDQVRTAMAAAEVVFHLAALPRVARSVADPLGTHIVNVNGTLNVLLAARDSGARRVVFASSSSVYGDTRVLPEHEELPPRPRSPYAASKLACEAYCRSFGAVYGLETVSLRFFNVFGPRQDPTGEYATAVPRFISLMLSGERPVVFGDGRQSRDFTHIENVVRACRLAADAGPDAVGEVVNVGCGQRTSLLELIDMLNGILRTELEPEFTDPRPGDVRETEAAIGRAEALLGYRPWVDLRTGLASTVDWFVEHAPILGGSA